MATHRVDDGQSLVDIALQRYGGVEGVFRLLEDNKVTLDESLAANDALLVDEEYAVVATVQNYYQQRRRRIATEYIPLAEGGGPTSPVTLEYNESEYEPTEYA